MTKIIDLQMFPCINYIKELINSTNIEINANESMQKRSFRNRYIILGANGLISLTAPIKGGREQKHPINEILIDYSNNWQIKHWRALQSSYMKSPFFEYYAENVHTLLFSKEESLFLFDLKILNWLLEVLNINTIIKILHHHSDIQNDAIDRRNHFLPKSYQNECEENHITYSQVFEDRFGFQQNLSILDLIFCEGPNAINLLKNSC